MIHYGAKAQLNLEEATIPITDYQGIKSSQNIVGEFLLYWLAADNKILVALNDIRTQQDSATESTNKAIDQLINYLTTYLDDGIVYRYRNKVLAAHSDAGFHNKPKGCYQSGAHIFLAKDESVPQWNGPILTIAQIISLSCPHPHKLNSASSSSQPNKYFQFAKPRLRWSGLIFLLQNKWITLRRQTRSMTPLLRAKLSPWTCNCIGYAIAKPNNKTIFTGPLVPTISLTTALSTTRQFTTNQNVPYFRVPLRGYTKPFYRSSNVLNEVMYFYLNIFI